MRSTSYLVPLIGLAGCSVGPSEDQMAALNGCTDVWRTEFSDMYGDTDGVTRRRALAVMAPEDIAFDSSGHFEFRQPPDQWRDGYDTQFECEGNIKSRTVEIVRLDNREVKPLKGQEWSFK